MMKKRLILLVLVTLVVVSACLTNKQPSASKSIVAGYRLDVDSLLWCTQRMELCMQRKAADSVSYYFMQGRKHYKRAEFLAEYYQPYTCKFINGPNLTEVEAEAKNRMVDPEGFQVIEELWFGAEQEKDWPRLQQLSSLLVNTVQRLRNTAQSITPTDVQVFDAMRIEMIRLFSLGLSGYDSPIAENSLNEAVAALQKMKDVLQAYGTKDDAKPVDEAIAYILQHNHFTSFDRAVFYRQYFLPVLKVQKAVQATCKIENFKQPNLINPDSLQWFSAGAYKQDYFVAYDEYASNPEKIALGKTLFYSNLLSAEGSRSCATCHNPELAFTDGLTTAAALGHKSLKRNTPTLLYAGLQAAQFHDARMNYLEDQAKAVVENEEEMHGSFEAAMAQIKKNDSLSKAYARAFPKEVEMKPVHLQNALAAYIRSLSSFSSPFDKYMSGHSQALSDTALRGYNLFMGKAKCGTCHFQPLFNGTLPPLFQKTETEVLGAPATAMAKQPDTDAGRMAVDGIEKNNHAFKTPTMRNIALTAPYMHNGVFKTLEQVIEFYNKGGAAGQGVDLPNQTLPAKPLNLSVQEMQELIVFLKTLTDTRY